MMARSVIGKVWCVALVAVLVGCGSDDVDEEGGFNTEEDPWVSAVLEVSPQVLEFSPDIDTEESLETVVTNEGPGPVMLQDLEWDQDSSSAFSLGQGAVDEPIELDEGSSHIIEVVYAPEAMGYHEGRLEILSNSETMPTVDVEMVSEDVRRTLFVQPSFVHFPQTVVGGQQERSVVLRNLGRDALTVESADIAEGSAYFRVEDERWDSPVTIDAGEREELILVFEPDDEEPRAGELVLESDDPDAAEVSVELSGNGVEPCLEVVSGDLDFGGSTVGQQSRELVSLRNCGPLEDVEIGSFEPGELDGEGQFEAVDGVFSLDEDSVEGGDTLVTLEPGQMDYFWVQYTPESEATDEGMLKLSSNDPASPHYLEMTGEGIPDPCPEAVIEASLEGESVALEEPTIISPLDTLTFDAGQSADPDGEALEYHWELVERPMTSMVEFDDPSAVEQSLMFSTTGQYRVELQVETSAGVEACEPATVTLMALPGDEIHVELSWHAPLTDDGTGADLDLHYLNSNGHWGDNYYSIFWNNRTPDWGDGSHVSLDIDDMTGEFPETVVHQDPSPASDYHVGVHYFGKMGAVGPAQAVVEIYVDGHLRHSSQRVLYESGNGGVVGESGDFWHVADIEVDESDVIEVVPVDQYTEDQGFPGADP